MCLKGFKVKTVKAHQLPNISCPRKGKCMQPRTACPLALQLHCRTPFRNKHIFMQRKLHLAWYMPWFCANYTDELQHMFQLFKLHIGNCPFLFVNGGYYFVSVIFAILKDAKGTLQATKLGWTIIMRLKIFGMMKGNPLNLCEHVVNM